MARKATIRDIYDDFADRMGVSKKLARIYVDFVFGDMRVYLDDGCDVSVKNFGTFSAKTAAPRTARNVRSNETITIPARKVIKFKMSKALLREYNGGGSDMTTEDDD